MNRIHTLFLVLAGIVIASTPCGVQADPIMPNLNAGPISVDTSQVYGNLSHFIIFNISPNDVREGTFLNLGSGGLINHTLMTSGLLIIAGTVTNQSILRPNLTFTVTDSPGVETPKVASVPEPSSLLFLAVGLVALAWWRRKLPAL